MKNVLTISAEEKNRIRGLHKNYSIIKEESGDMISGIPTNSLHSITQEWLSKGQTMNWVQILRMITGCYVNDENKPQYSVLNPTRVDSDDYVHTDGKKYPISISTKLDGKSSFCMTGGRSVCINPCKLSLNAQKSDLPSDVREMVVPALVNMMNSSTIDNLGMDDFDDTTYDRYEKGGSMLGWRGDDNGQFKLEKI